MQPGSRRGRVIEAMRISSRPLDDGQLADRTGISPRQSVNQICRELERAGLVRRRPGPGGKIVNEWLGNGDRQPDSVPRTSGAGVCQTAVLTEAPAIRAGHELPPGSSREQRDAERVMLDLFNGDGYAEILQCRAAHDWAPGTKGAAASGSLRHKISRGLEDIVVEIQVSLKASASTLWRCALTWAVPGGPGTRPLSTGPRQRRRPRRTRQPVHPA